ncbi:MAG: indole-3-glycerol-phosphate synthase, partial [Thermoanaerobaculia bacterium]|nr:indole-3-glycerol-phosphate synthase [Thermoanaerobaculia bacterium]
MTTDPGVADVLRRIVARRRRSVPPDAPEAGAAGGVAVPLAVEENPFLAALAGRRGRAVIAEVKMGSPKLGSLAGRVDPLAQARLYARHGAAALSVVVEPEHFHGSYELLAACREASGLPALAKDFVVGVRQLAWAREAGADAVLLIAALHPAEELARLAGRARSLGLAPLVECHADSDFDKLAGARWELAGINNRDLTRFEVDLERSARKLHRLPDEALKVAESGIAAAADVGGGGGGAGGAGRGGGVGGGGGVVERGGGGAPLPGAGALSVESGRG